MRSPIPATVVLVLSSVAPLTAQVRDTYDSGGTLTPDQAAFDALYYELDVRVEPADSSVSGALTMTAALTSLEPEIGLDLDPLLEVHGVALGRGSDPAPVDWRRDGGSEHISTWRRLHFKATVRSLRCGTRYPDGNEPPDVLGVLGWSPLSYLSH